MRAPPRFAVVPAAPRLFFDYVDPLSWVWERAVSAREATGGVHVERHPLELRPPPSELLEPGDPAWLARWARARAALPPGEISPSPPDLVPWTRKAHELALLTREKGVFQRIHESLFHAYLREGKDIGRVDVLVALAVHAGLDRSETKAVLDIDRHSLAAEALAQEAERLGVRGVPTLLAGDRRLEDVPVRELDDLLAIL